MPDITKDRPDFSNVTDEASTTLDEAPRPTWSGQTAIILNAQSDQRVAFAGYGVHSQTVPSCDHLPFHFPACLFE